MNPSNPSVPAYEAPRIELRTEISTPLVGGGGSPILCATFTHG
jgi:hypothetical protein